MKYSPQAIRWLATGAVIAMSFCTLSHAAPDLDTVLAGDQRSAVNRARDGYRHPAETLAFFGLKPDMTVVELWPGGGWYTEILAPYLRDSGKLYAAHFPASSDVAYYSKGRAAFEAKLAANPMVYDRVVVTELAPPTGLAIAPPGSADMVLTFRNVHNWLKPEGNELNVMKAAFNALKPGGVLGVVEHRAADGTSREQSLESGYVAQQLVIDAAQAAGFVIEQSSEINANPRDTHDHPKGVWTLPPSFALGEQDRDLYLDIGESDRMTLLFRKPAQ